VTLNLVEADGTLADLVGSDAPPPAAEAAPDGYTPITRALELTEQQRQAVQKINDWYLGTDQVFRLFGYAGTGKTTLAQHIVDSLGVMAHFAAYTGKAAHVLRSKGCFGASTIHSLIYSPQEKVRQHLEELRQKLRISEDDDEVEALEAQIRAEEDRLATPDFILKEDSDLSHSPLLVLDEVSMVGTRVAGDLLSFGTKVLCLGDPAQLPPVDGGGYFIHAPADHLLTEIHRSALDSPVTRLATNVRQSPPGDRTLGMPGMDGDSGRCQAVSRDQLTGFDQVLVGTNKTRWLAIHLLRGLHGLTGSHPVPGDRIIGLSNSSQLGIFNGQQFLVVETTPPAPDADRIRLVVEDDAGDRRSLVAWTSGFLGFEGEKKAKREGRGSVAAMTFAQAITCHKCVHPDTLVETPDGIQAIRDIADSGVIATPTGPESYHGKFVRASGPVLAIGTKRGYGLTVTPEHGMTAWRDGHVRVEASDLTVGDWLRVRLGSTIESEPPELPSAPVADVRARPYRIPSRMTADLAELLGLMVADGCVFRRGFRLAKRHHSVVDRFILLVKDLFGYDAPKRFLGTTPYAEICSTLITSWFEAIGGMQPCHKHVPAVILRSPMDFQAAFLRGLFEDGTVNRRDDQIDHIEWTNRDHAVAGVVQTMLLRFGIIATRARYRNTSRLCLYGPHAKAFASRIGFVADEKNARLHGARYSGDTRDLIPLTRAELALIEPVLSQAEKQNARRNGYISRQVASKALAMAESDARSLLADRLDWHYERITTITTGESETMCVTVPEGSRFLQNGFDGWNSQGSQWDNVLVVDESWIFARAAAEEAQRAGKTPEEAAAAGHIAGQRWLYTAITRAAQRVVVIASPRGLPA
jgi:exodeoxyribonuclease-5